MEGTTRWTLMAHSVAAMAIDSFPDPVMRRIDLEYCQIDDNGTHWHAKREVGQPQLQLEDRRDGISRILFRDNIQSAVTIYRSTQVCKHALMSPQTVKNTCGKDLVRDLQSSWTRTTQVCCNGTDEEGGNIDEEDELYINGEDINGQSVAAELVRQQNDLAQYIIIKGAIDRCHS
jgi:hypothetical protein